MSRLGFLGPRGRRWGGHGHDDIEPPADPDDALTFDDPVELAARVASAPRPIVLAFDLDGTLAPLVPHPSLSEFPPGVLADLTELTSVAGVTIAVVSGRPWHDIESQFALPSPVVAVGSHGLERGRPGADLDPDERRRVARLAMLAGSAAAKAPGAWVEHKPAGVALHVRQAPAEAAAVAMRVFLERISTVQPVEVLPGDEVVEVAVRRYDKGQAIRWLRDQHHAASLVFVGDDLTDEYGFGALEPGDIGVKVGGADTVAAHRLRDPEDVADFVAALVRAVTGRP